MFSVRSTSKLSKDALRPFTLFMGLTGPRFCFASDSFASPLRLSRPVDKLAFEKLASRVFRNLHYFAANYALVALIVCLGTAAAMRPIVLIYAGAVWVLCRWLAATIGQDVRWTIRGINVGRVLTPWVRVSLSAVLITWVVVSQCFEPLLVGLVISKSLVLLHAMTRDPARVAEEVMVSKSSGLAGESSDGALVLLCASLRDNDGNTMTLELEDVEDSV